jgi:hypothetical protein
VLSTFSVGSRYASVSEIGDAENISKCYVSRILRLTNPPGTRHRRRNPRGEGGPVADAGAAGTAAAGELGGAAHAAQAARAVSAVIGT